MAKKTQSARMAPSIWNRTRLKSILSKMQGRRVLVVGDVGVDRYTIGAVERISPEAPVPIVTVTEEKLKLGLAANVADNIQALGATALLTGVIGQDRSAQDFRALLEDAGIAASHLVMDRTRRTVLKERVVSDRQQLLRVDYENTHLMDPSVEKLLLKKVSGLLSQCDAVILQDYAKGMSSRPFFQSVMKAAKGARKFVTVDPNSKTSVKFYSGAFLLTPNVREAENLSGVKIRDDASLLEAGQKIIKLAKLSNLVITRGKEGMALFKQGSKSISHIPTYAREVYDVSGAGDTVISVMTLALASGATLEESAVLGNLAAGVEVGKRGTATVSRDEILLAMDFVDFSLMR
ncbi:D-glycero-beta-D-manno-heptose-7-phosphate kinase [bacterium]|nr:D-glycero-beta-D-manno-heptose-7-phosphate kinase [bacterium]